MEVEKIVLRVSKKYKIAPKYLRVTIGQILEGNINLKCLLEEKENEKESSKKRINSRNNK